MLKMVYPVVFTELKNESGYMAFVPDFDINTQGETLAEAIVMARDAIGLCGIDIQDDNKILPKASTFVDIKAEENQIVSMVDIDFDAYRRANEKRAVRKNVTLPSWLNDAAENAGINFSAVLQEALKNMLNVSTTDK